MQDRASGHKYGAFNTPFPIGSFPINMKIKNVWECEIFFFFL